MIVLNTNGKYEYSNFCNKENSVKVERWLETYKCFLMQHRENIIMEFSPKAQKVNIHFATIPSERKDTNGSPCDTSLTAIDIQYSDDDYSIMLSMIKYALREGFDSLGDIIDTYFKEDFFNVKNQEDIQSEDKEELVNSRLDKLCRKHLQIDYSEKTVELPTIDSYESIWKSVKSVKYNELEAAIRQAKDDEEVDKYILIVTRLNVSEEKIEKFGCQIKEYWNQKKTSCNANKKDEIVKAIIFRTGIENETNWATLQIKKKKMQLPTKVGLMTVIVGITTAGLMVWQAPSPKESTNSQKEQATSKIDSSLSYYKNLAVNYLEAVNEATRTIDSLKNLQYYTDTVNNTTVQIDLGEFSKTGVCAIYTVSDSIISDTIVIRSNVDFIKTKKCYINIYKNSDTKPFKQIAPVDINGRKK